MANEIVDKPTVAVVIPVFNSEKYIEESVRSVQVQTYRVSEIILVDDGSTDDSLNIINRMAALDERIIVIAQSNSGPSKARNVGMLKSKSDIVAFNDADDVWMESKVESQINQLILEGAQVSFTNLIVVDESGFELKKHNNIIYSGSREDFIRALIHNKLTMITPTALFYRSCLSDGMLFNENIRNYEDLIFFLKMVSNYKAVLCEKPLVKRRQHSRSTSVALNVGNILMSMDECVLELKEIGLIKYVPYFKSYVYFAIAHFHFRNKSRAKSLIYSFRSFYEKPVFKNLALIVLSVIPFSYILFNGFSSRKGLS